LTPQIYDSAGGRGGPRFFSKTTSKIKKNENNLKEKLKIKTTFKKREKKKKTSKKINLNWL
jgi:hypothetical protein